MNSPTRHPFPSNRHHGSASNTTPPHRTRTLRSSTLSRRSGPSRARKSTYFGVGLVTSAMMCSNAHIVRAIRSSDNTTKRTSGTTNQGTGALSRSRRRQRRAKTVAAASARMVALNVFQSIGYCWLSRTIARRSEAENPITIDVDVMTNPNREPEIEAIVP
jgi:hypothetical protein